MHLAQLYGIAMGLDIKDIVIDAHQVKVDPVIKKIEEAFKEQDIITGGE